MFKPALLVSLVVVAGACVGPGPEPAPPRYRLEAPLPVGERTRVLVLGTEHLRTLGDRFKPALLDHLIDGLDQFGPDAIAVEALPPEEIARLADAAAASPGGAAAELLEAFAGEPARYGREAQRALGLSRTEASARLDSLLATRPGPDTPARRALALHFLAAWDLPSALLQWSYLPEEQRGPGGPITPSIADFLTSRLESPNEIVSIGVALARRRGIDRLLSVDDHVDDEIGLRTRLNERLGAQLPGNQAYEDLVASDYFQQVRKHLPEAAAQGDLLPLYVLINSPEYLNRDISSQWHLFFRTALPSKDDRARAALWEARNLNIAGRIRSASAWHPGDRILVVIGSGHKPFLDRYLAQMMDIQVVQLGEILPKGADGHSGE